METTVSMTLSFQWREKTVNRQKGEIIMGTMAIPTSGGELQTDGLTELNKAFNPPGNIPNDLNVLLETKKDYDLVTKAELEKALVDSNIFGQEEFDFFWKYYGHNNSPNSGMTKAWKMLADNCVGSNPIGAHFYLVVKKGLPNADIDPRIITSFQRSTATAHVDVAFQFPDDTKILITSI
jgi:hypothetical protein